MYNLLNLKLFNLHQTTGITIIRGSTILDVFEINSWGSAYTWVGLYASIYGSRTLNLIDRGNILGKYLYSVHYHTVCMLITNVKSSMLQLFKRLCMCYLRICNFC
jgi:hypothetical protein